MDLTFEPNGMVLLHMTTAICPMEDRQCSECWVKPEEALNFFK